MFDLWDISMMKQEKYIVLVKSILFNFNLFYIENDNFRNEWCFADIFIILNNELRVCVCLSLCVWFHMHICDHTYKHLHASCVGYRTASSNKYIIY